MSLWKHQSRGVEFALQKFDSHGGCLLAWEMGTGKTRAALEVAKRRATERMLVVAPKAVLPVWRTEASRYFSDSPAVLTLDQKSTKAKAKELALFGSGIVTVNYESAWREPLATALKHWKPDLLVLDEVHRIKANRGKASRWIGAFATSIEARLGLSGTPLAHSPLDIYGLYRALAPDIFPSSDLALQVALAHAFGHETRPSARRSAALALPWAPWRSVAARLFWAYYAAITRREAAPAS